ncbi:hypothetical protein FRZ67_05710 [Panacibacter ginsenosidivorans]|uniref:Uncharacterized protein n=1 Tax=Panacibacter ginsenosidivorans TaxID=1813871 RepID=A0A5B8V7D1_9BACT|nr:hypothetical protein [Panacibacter ginsenosidivorans]QEC66823.1 hypothetical protein FRZ67_05710 [Panacibacter ginsenosidivorans]
MLKQQYNLLYKRAIAGIILFLIISFFASAQDDTITRIELPFKYKPDPEYIKKSIEFMEQVMGRQINDSSFILDDLPLSFNEFFMDRLIAAADTSFLSKDELRFIEKKRYPSLTYWSKEILPNVKIISHDTIENIFKHKPDGWGYFRKNIGEAINEFSFPVFLRNYTYCIFCFDYSCGWVCGSGKMVLYKKYNNKWVQVKIYCEWVS